MHDDSDGVLEADKLYTLRKLAKKLGVRDTRRLRRVLIRYGVWGVTVCRRRVYIGADIIAAFGNHAGPDGGPEYPGPEFEDETDNPSNKEPKNEQDSE